MRIIRNYDVASYYPHLLTINGYISRNISDAKIYADMLEKRMQAKKSGDKVTANALKLIANTTYGAQLNRYNDLYDPLMARSVCISGQLYLMELANHLYVAITELQIVQLNTDGIMLEFDDSQYDQVKAIIEEWQERTGFELEEDQIHAIIQKDVNNYVEVPTGNLYGEDGKPRWKIKGGYLVRGIAPAGAFNINNNANIVANAIVEYFVNGTDPADTINGCSDLFQFQMIAKAGQKYREAYHIVNGEKQPVQKVNRVYATADERYEKLYKVKAENDSNAKIEMLPEHCIIDNNNELTINDIDKGFYIDMARKRINDFLGIKPEKQKKERTSNMARTATSTAEKPVEFTNVLQKLQRARELFLAGGAKKSGMNTDIEFLYFELKDIVPAATAIFEQVGLIPVVYFDKEMAYMDMLNVDNREDKVTFTIPLASWQGNKAVNPIQVIGATVTYYRRYLYQIALDIVEADEIDSKPEKALVTEEPAPVSEPPKAPATPQERTKIKKELTNADGQADALQIAQLKKTCKALKDKVKGTDRQGPVEDWLAQIAMATQGFTQVSKANCAKILEKVAEKIKEVE